MKTLTVFALLVVACSGNTFEPSRVVVVPEASSDARVQNASDASSPRDDSAVRSQDASSDRSSGGSSGMNADASSGGASSDAAHDAHELDALDAHELDAHELDAHELACTVGHVESCPPCATAPCCTQGACGCFFASPTGGGCFR